MKENRHPRHDHYFIFSGQLHESFRKSRGDLSYDFVCYVDMPDSDKLTEQQIKKIFDETEPKRDQ